MPYGPRPRGASNTSMMPVAGSRRPYTPCWPVNHSSPPASKVAVFKLALGRPDGNWYTVTCSVAGSTLTMASSPPSVTQGAPSGPTITPWGRDPGPSPIWCVPPVAGSRRPSSPDPWAVYQTPPSGAGATSWGRDPAGTGYETISSRDAGIGAGRVVVVAGRRRHRRRRGSRRGGGRGCRGDGGRSRCGRDSGRRRRRRGGRRRGPDGTGRRGGGGRGDRGGLRSSVTGTCDNDQGEDEEEGCWSAHW